MTLRDSTMFEVVYKVGGEQEVFTIDYSRFKDLGFTDQEIEKYAETSCIAEKILSIAIKDRFPDKSNDVDECVSKSGSLFMKTNEKQLDYVAKEVGFDQLYYKIVDTDRPIPIIRY